MWERASKIGSVSSGIGCFRNLKTVEGIRAAACPRTSRQLRPIGVPGRRQGDGGVGGQSRSRRPKQRTDPLSPEALLLSMMLPLMIEQIMIGQTPYRLRNWCGAAPWKYSVRCHPCFACGADRLATRLHPNCFHFAICKVAYGTQLPICRTCRYVGLSRHDLARAGTIRGDQLLCSPTSSASNLFPLLHK